MMHFAQLKTLASLGLILGASISNGRVAQRLKLPAITGFLLTGLIAGPSLLGILTPHQVASLQPVDHVALSLIALIAGSELKLSALTAQLRATLSVMFGLTLATFALTSLITYSLSAWIPTLDQATPVEVLSASTLLGVIMVARSPSAAIAMINELSASGRFTQLVLGVTVLMDVVVITLFAAALSLSQSLISGRGASLDFLQGLLAELTLSALFGTLLSWAVRGVLRDAVPTWLRGPFILSLSAGTFYLAEGIHHAMVSIDGIPLHFDPLLACLIAGVWIRNAYGDDSSVHQRFESQTSALSPWVYLTFFTLTGASLQLDLLILVWPLALIFFTVRLLGLGLGAMVGGVISGEPAHQHSYRWMGFVTQAGVGIGLAKRVASAFPTWGPSLATLIIGVIVLNELLGPLFFKRAIMNAGEANEITDDYISP